MKPTNVKVAVVVVVASTLAMGIAAPGKLLARGRWQDVIVPKARNRSRVPATAATVDGAPDGARSLAGGPAPAPAPAKRRTAERARAIAPPEVDPTPRTRISSRVLEHAAGDRLREALVAAQDDPRSANRIARLIAQAAAEARRNRALGDRVWYWRDPFSSNPRQPIVLNLEVQLEMQLWAARQEAARARVESAAARTEAAMAHVEVARTRVQMSNAHGLVGLRGGATGAHRDDRATGAQRIDDDDDATVPAPRHMLSAARDPGNDGKIRDGAAGDDRTPSHVRPRPARRGAPSETPLAGQTALARNEGTDTHANRHRDIGAARPASPGSSAADAPTTDPATWPSNDPRGIVVVPIIQPVASLPRKR